MKTLMPPEKSASLKREMRKILADPKRQEGIRAWESFVARNLSNDLSCPKHPKYQGKRKSNVTCRVCLTIYRLKNPK